MADGFDIHLDEKRAERLQAVAEAAGMSPTEFALGILDSAVSADFAEDDRRWAEYKRTGETISVEEAFAAFDAEIDRVRAQKAG